MARPRILVLDGYTLNPGDLQWTPIAALGDLVVHDRTPESRIVERASGFPIVLTNKAPIRDKTIQQLPDLQYIGVLATGTNIIDLQAARQRSIPVTNVPAYGSDSVAQWTIALLLELAGHTAAHGEAVRRGDWVKSPDFCFTVAPTAELAGKTLGIVGLGTIGQRVARIAAALGMKIAAAHQRSMSRVALPGAGVEIEWLPMDDLFAKADVISLHCPLTEQTRNLVNAERIAMMKRTAILVNTSRGPLVDEPALATALREGRIAAAGLDVLSVEPPTTDNPLLNAPRCLITPHVAWASAEARWRLLRMAAENVKAFLDGHPVNVVNG